MDQIDEPVYVASPPRTLERRRLLPIPDSGLSQSVEQLARGGVAGLIGNGRIGYFVVAGELVDEGAVSLLIREARGVLELCLLPSDCARLGLQPVGLSRLTASGEDQYESFEARTGLSTGISARDRARSIRVASDPTTGTHDINKPGHIIPVRGHMGTSLETRSLVNGAIDLARLAGLRPAAAVCAALGEDGNPLAGDAFVARCRELGLPVATVADVVSARMDSETVVSESGRTELAETAELNLPQSHTTLPEALPALPPRDGELEPISPELFRDVLGSVCTPVSVVTTMHRGRGHATTVSAFCSLSIDPPLVLVALDRGSDLLRLIRSSRIFGVNILADHQHAVALHLARKDPEKLAKVDWVEDAGLPRLLGSAGWLACRTHRIMAGGDHMVVTGLVVAAEHEAREPLLYRRRRFLSVS